MIHRMMPFAAAIGTVMALSAPTWAQTATTTGSVTGQADVGALAQVGPVSADLGANLGAGLVLTGTAANSGVNGVGASLNTATNANVNAGGTASGQAGGTAAGNVSLDSQTCASADAAFGMTSAQSGGDCAQ